MGKFITLKHYSTGNNIIINTSNIVYAESKNELYTRQPYTRILMVNDDINVAESLEDLQKILDV